MSTKASVEQRQVLRPTQDYFARKQTDREFKDIADQRLIHSVLSLIRAEEDDQARWHHSSHRPKNPRKAQREARRPGTKTASSSLSRGTRASRAATAAAGWGWADGSAKLSSDSRPGTHRASRSTAGAAMPGPSGGGGGVGVGGGSSGMDGSASFGSAGSAGARGSLGSGTGLGQSCGGPRPQHSSGSVATVSSTTALDPGHSVVSCRTRSSGLKGREGGDPRVEALVTVQVLKQALSTHKHRDPPAAALEIATQYTILQDLGQALEYFRVATLPSPERRPTREDLEKQERLQRKMMLMGERQRAEFLQELADKAARDEERRQAAEAARVRSAHSGVYQTLLELGRAREAAQAAEDRLALCETPSELHEVRLEVHEALCRHSDLLEPEASQHRAWLTQSGGALVDLHAKVLRGVLDHWHFEAQTPAESGAGDERPEGSRSGGGGSDRGARHGQDCFRAELLQVLGHCLAHKKQFCASRQAFEEAVKAGPQEEHLWARHAVRSPEHFLDVAMEEAELALDKRDISRWRGGVDADATRQRAIPDHTLFAGTHRGAETVVTSVPACGWPATANAAAPEPSHPGSSRQCPRACQGGGAMAASGPRGPGIVDPTGTADAATAAATAESRPWAGGGGGGGGGCSGRAMCLTANTPAAAPRRKGLLLPVGRESQGGSRATLALGGRGGGARRVAAGQAAGGGCQLGARWSPPAILGGYAVPMQAITAAD